MVLKTKKDRNFVLNLKRLSLMMSTVCIKLKITVRSCIWGNTLTSEAVVVVPGNHIKAYKLIGVGGRVGEGQACRG